MRFVTFRTNGDVPQPGVMMDDAVVPLGGTDGVAQSMLELIAKGDAALDKTRDLAMKRAPLAVPAKSVALLAPIPRPSKNVFCVGRNYHEHVEEGDRASGRNVGAPPVPIFFTKPPTTVVGPEAPVVRHRQTTKLDYEVELAVVIGRTCRNVGEDDALDVVWGYTVVNDVTARDLQDRHGQWFKGKGLDTFCPMGPVLVSRDEIADPHALDIELRVNGEMRQHHNTRHMIFTINRIIADLSAGMTLEAGDIIATGTCSGCAFAMTPPGWLQPGDVMEAEVQSIGVLRNTIVEG